MIDTYKWDKYLSDAKEDNSYWLYFRAQSFRKGTMIDWPSFIREFDALGLA